METNKEFWTIIDDKNVKTSDIIKEARKLFGCYIWNEDNIDKELPSPEETITVSFKKSIEPDEEHRNKSYNDFIKEDKKYMTGRQYLLLAIHVFKEIGEHLDVKGWTRTSSLWSDGYLVDGYWYPSSRKLCLNYGYRDGRSPGGGPREQMNLSLIPSKFNPSESSELDSAIEICKKHGLTVTKQY